MYEYELLQDTRDWSAFFKRALGLSIAVHAIVLATVPGPLGPASVLPDVIRIDARIMPLPRPAVQPEPRPEPPPKPKSQVAPAPPPAPRAARVAKPAENRIERRIEPVAERLVRPAEPKSEPAIVRSEVPTLPENPVASVAPEPRPEPKPPTPVQPVAAIQPEATFRPAAQREARPSPELLGRYGQDVSGALAARQRYPRLAQIRGWQGTAELEIEFLPGGRTGDITIARSSGHAVLDDQALEMMRSAELPRRPDGLRNQTFALRVPVEFRLRN